MTNSTISVPEANATLTRISKELDEARQDVALLERLQTAQARVKTLAAEQVQAIRARDAAIVAEQKARKAARYKGLNDLRIIEKPAEHGGGVLRNGYTINYTRTAWDMNAGQNVPQPVSIGGFTSLPDDVFAWIIEKHPQSIPAAIMNLAPGDPLAAFEAYFSGLRRGYIAK